MDAMDAEKRMKRRGWLSLLGGSAALLAAAGGWSAQTPASVQNPPRPKGSEPATGDEDEPKLPPTKGVLQANEKDIKKNVEKLYALAGELKAEVEKTDSSLVLSLAMVKKAEEIEKLAHEIKSRAKGT